MNKWMTAINAQIHRLFIKQYNVPADNYQSRGYASTNNNIAAYRAVISRSFVNIY